MSSGTAGADMHLFILIDEAQELYLRELNWLKAVINKLVKKRVKVTTVLMGLRQLLDRVDELKKAGRRDLIERFFKRVIEFKGCRMLDDFSTLCEAVDSRSEYPGGSGWTYARFLFPQAHVAGFRLPLRLWMEALVAREANHVPPLWRGHYLRVCDGCLRVPPLPMLRLQ